MYTEEEECIEKVCMKLLNSPFIKDSECLWITALLTNYFEDCHGIKLTTYFGFIIDRRDKSDECKECGGIHYHVWSGYNNKKIDITAHKQEDKILPAIVLDKEIQDFGKQSDLFYILSTNDNLIQNNTNDFINHIYEIFENFKHIKNLFSSALDNDSIIDPLVFKQIICDRKSIMPSSREGIENTKESAVKQFTNDYEELCKIANT